MLSIDYLDQIESLVARIRETQTGPIQQAAQAIAESIANNGILHVFGSGHSHMMAEDLFHRAGGLACVNAMLEESLMELNVGRATQLERLSGYAKVLLRGYDLRPGEAIIIVSNSGMNAVPIEMALECKKLGLYVIALTCMDHTVKVSSRHDSGKKLYEIADLVLDNGGVYGDAMISYGPNRQKAGASSTIGGLIVLQTLMMAIVEELQVRQVKPPVLVSANTEGGDRHNRELIARYHARIRYLPNPASDSFRKEGSGD